MGTISQGETHVVVKQDEYEVWLATSGRRHLSFQETPVVPRRQALGHEPAAAYLHAVCVHIFGAEAARGHSIASDIKVGGGGSWNGHDHDQQTGSDGGYGGRHRDECC